ncbi:MAG: acyl-CoA dehydrogenase family protein [Thermoleophilia bacterium]
MNLTLSDEQVLLTKTARAFMEKRFPKDVLDRIDEAGEGYSSEIWEEMAELGWMGLVIPEEYDGVGMTFEDLALLLEEIGRIRPISPFFSTVIFGALPIMELGTEEQKGAILPKIAMGESIVTLALTEAGASYRPEGIALTATPSDDDYVLRGSKMFVPDAHVADQLICVARTREGADAADGVTLFVVDATSHGITCIPHRALNEDVVCEVRFEDVKVPKGAVLGSLDQGWEHVRVILDRAAVATCCEMVGGAQRVLEIAVEYAKVREQFGRLIGSFQAIQHHCANMLADVDASRMITYEAAWRIGEGLPYAVEAAMAKSWVSDAYRRVVLLGHQVSGGSGLIVEHDMPRYFKGSKVAEMTFGDARFNRKLLAERLGY